MITMELSEQEAKLVKKHRAEVQRLKQEKEDMVFLLSLATDYARFLVDEACFAEYCDFIDLFGDRLNEYKGNLPSDALFSLTTNIIIYSRDMVKGHTE